MKMFASTVALTVAAANGLSEFERIAQDINSKGLTWTAKAPEKFGSLDDVKRLLGAAQPGDDNFVSYPVKTSFTEGVELPTEFDSATNWPQCTNIANVRDQSSCGSCWAFGSVSSFESRACIATGKDIKYSPEMTASCFTWGDGCQGGNNVWSDFKSTGVVTGGDYYDTEGETCARYTLKPCAHHVPSDEKYQPCPSTEYHETNCPSSCESGYGKSFNQDKLHAASTYSVRGEQNIMQELVENGPLYVSFTVYDDFPTYNGGVYKRQSSSALGGHAVTLVGYGELNGEKYWKVKNSWNDHWGVDGHFLIARGSNECGIEGNVGAGTIATDTVV